jgi:hypothetical protein
MLPRNGEQLCALLVRQIEFGQQLHVAFDGALLFGWMRRCRRVVLVLRVRRQTERATGKQKYDEAKQRAVDQFCDVTLHDP